MTIIQISYLCLISYLSHRSLHISDDGPVRIIQKLNSNLGDISSISSSTKNFIDFGKLHWLILKKYYKQSHCNMQFIPLPWQRYAKMLNNIIWLSSLGGWRSLANNISTHHEDLEGTFSVLIAGVSFGPLMGPIRTNCIRHTIHTNPSTPCHLTLPI